MLVYRIVLAKYAHGLIASGRAARWNPNEVKMIYTASSRSLACLENVVHRNYIGLSENFKVLTIDCLDTIQIAAIRPAELPENWTDFGQMHITQQIGEKWIRQNESAILQVPSSIVEAEVNYLLNPAHSDFKKIRIIANQTFTFDKRLRQ